MNQGLNNEIRRRPNQVSPEISAGAVPEAEQGVDIEVEEHREEQAAAEAKAEAKKAEKKIAGPDEVISPELQQVRRAIAQSETKGDTVAPQKLVEDMLNNVTDLTDPYVVNQLLIEQAKKRAEKSQN